MTCTTATQFPVPFPLWRECLTAFRLSLWLTERGFRLAKNSEPTHSQTNKEKNVSLFSPLPSPYLLLIFFYIFFFPLFPQSTFLIQNVFLFWVSSFEIVFVCLKILWTKSINEIDAEAADHFLLWIVWYVIFLFWVIRVSWLPKGMNHLCYSRFSSTYLFFAVTCVEEKEIYFVFVMEILLFVFNVIRNYIANGKSRLNPNWLCSLFFFFFLLHSVNFLFVFFFFFNSGVQKHGKIYTVI